MVEALTATCFSPGPIPAPAWAAGKQYGAGDLASFNGNSYRCLQAHRSQAGWEPSRVPALWVIPTPCGVTAWKVQTAYSLESVVTFAGNTYQCRQAHTSATGWEPTATPALWQKVPAPVCNNRVQDQEQVLTQHLEVSEAAGAFGLVTLVVDRVLDFATQGFNSLNETGAVRLGDGAEVFSYSLTDTGGKFSRATVHWGPHVSGARNATFNTSDGKISGDIDGRRFTPSPLTVDPASVTFLDGGPSPKLTTNPVLQEALRRLGKRAAEVTAQCAIDAPAAGTASPAAMAALAAAGRLQDPGHFTDTYAAGSCKRCKAGVVALGVSGGVGCALACGATFGLGCGLCIAGVTAAVEAGIIACEESKACCPVSCGSGLGSTCCAGDEACLNGAGLCCSPGTVTCAAKACCASDQSCIATGPNKGTCCPDASVCGPNCCTDAETCQNAGSGQCCLPSKVCGTACCGRDPAGLPPGTIVPESICADASRNLCCRPGETACNGICCGGNRECRNNQCVFKPTINCGVGGVVCIDGAGQPIPGACPAARAFCDKDGCCVEIPR